MSQDPSAEMNAELERTSRLQTCEAPEVVRRGNRGLTVELSLPRLPVSMLVFDKVDAGTSP